MAVGEVLIPIGGVIIIGGVFIWVWFQAKPVDPATLPPRPPEPPQEPERTPCPFGNNGSGPQPLSEPNPKPLPLPPPEPQPQPQPDPFVPQVPDATLVPKQDPPKIKHISLSIWRYIAMFTWRLNRQLNPQNIYVYQFPDWFDQGLSSVPASGSFFPKAFEQATVRAEQIHFNLEGIRGDPSLWAEEAGGQGDFGKKKQFTAWELYKIKHNSVLCGKTNFYPDGVTPSSDAKRKICGL